MKVDPSAASADRPLGRGPFTVGRWRVDPVLDELSTDGSTVKLEPRTMRLLVALAERAGEVVTPDDLLDAVWPGLVVSQSSVYQGVAQLRRTLGDQAATPAYIATVPRKGYRLIAPVARAVDAPTTRRSMAPEPPGAHEASADAVVPPAVDASTTPHRRRVLLVGVAGAVGMSLAGAGAWVLWRGAHVPSVARPVRIAVLPFTDESKGGLEQATADGLADDVIRRFERHADVLVSARNSAFTIRRVTEDRAGLAAVRADLHADYALLGELFRHGERFTAAVRLLAVDATKPLWADSFTANADGLASLPDRIANGALAALGVPSPPPGPIDSLTAYELYLLGKNALGTSRNMEGIRKARDYFQHAIDADAAYARAYAGMAETWLAQGTYGSGIDLRDATARAQSLIDKALALEPTLLDALLLQGLIYTRTSWTEGERARAVMKKAVELYPGSAAARFNLGVSDAFDERPREAMAHYARALESDPLNGPWHGRWAIDAVFAGDYDTARTHIERADALAPGSPYRHLTPAYLEYAQGHVGAAVEHYRRQLAIDARRPDQWNELGWLYLDLGLFDAASEAFERQVALTQGAHGSIDGALVPMAAGRTDRVEAYIASRRLERPVPHHDEAERLRTLAMAGRTPSIGDIDAAMSAMRTDAVPWVGSFWVFLGWLLWIDLAMLYVAAGSASQAAPLLDDATAMLERLRQRGNAFHTIPFLEARIAALRGQRDRTVERMTEAVAHGWRRGWVVALDPAFASMRDDARLEPLLARVASDMQTQRASLA